MSPICSADLRSAPSSVRVEGTYIGSADGLGGKSNEVISPESFLANKHNKLDGGEPERAQRWGERLAERASHSLLSRKWN